MKLSAQETAAEILDKDHILILSHQNPDGDTLGCAFALYGALTALNKQAKVYCCDALPPRFSYLYKEYREASFVPSYVIAVDVAASHMLGALEPEYGDRVDLCIDHHPSNGLYAKKTFLDPTAAAASELIYQVIRQMGVTLTPQMANCLYTGIATDTGCFKFSNTSVQTHRIAAELFVAGADHEFINEYLFDTKSRARFAIEREVLKDIEFFCGGRVAMIRISQELIHSTGVDESELAGVAGIPRTVEGVMVGITMREKKDGTEKISVRTTADVDASAVCAHFGGGGHARAAGCHINGDYETAKKQMLDVCTSILEGQA